MNSKRRNQIEKYLDAGHGVCHLGSPECAEIVRSALSHFEGERYYLGAWAVMPNHVHVIVKPLDGHELADIVSSWKKFTARRINKVVGRVGELWQPEPFDHLIRDGDHFIRFSQYVLDNPRNAGLNDWKWFGVGSLGLGVESSPNI